METVEVTACFLELLDPFLGLRDHHMAIECAFPVLLLGFVDMTSNLGDDWGAEGDVGHEVPVHYIDMQPVCTLRDGV